MYKAFDRHIQCFVVEPELRVCFSWKPLKNSHEFVEHNWVIREEFRTFVSLNPNQAFDKVDWRFHLFKFSHISFQVRFLTTKSNQIHFIRESQLEIHKEINRSKVSGMNRNTKTILIPSPVFEKHIQCFTVELEITVIEIWTTQLKDSSYWRKFDISIFLDLYQAFDKLIDNFTYHHS